MRHRCWRLGLIERLVESGVPRTPLFNPVVDDWNEAAQKEEDFAKEVATYQFYYLGDPKMEDNRLSLYSMLEAVLGLFDAPERTVVVFDSTDMPKFAVKSMAKSCKDLQKRFPEGMIFGTLEEAETWLAKNVT